MNDADPGRYDAEPVERLRAPFQKAVTLVVAFELLGHVELICGFAAGIVNLYRVIDNEVNWNQRFDHAGVLTQPLYGGTHGSQIDKQRHAGEILQNDACHHERDLLRALTVCGPSRQFTHICLADALAAVKIAKDRLKNDADRDRQP